LKWSGNKIPPYGGFKDAWPKPLAWPPWKQQAEPTI
jgi:hypothetical protein